MLKLVFAGTPDVAVPSLKAFAADPRFDVVGVITRPDAPTGRGRKLTPSPVKATALELGLPVIDLKPRSPEFMEALNNVAIVWEEEPSAYHVGYDEEWDIEPAFVEDEDGPESYTPAERDAKDDAAAEDAGGEYEAEDDEDEFDDLLGLFDGLSIVERANGYDDDIPDVITIFKGPHERCFNSREEIVEEVGKTIIHELGHYFGLNEDQLAAMGYE